jgi:Na+-driven multidrug efflux pump
LRLKPDSFSAVTSSLKGIIGIGLPSAVQYALTVVAVSAQSAFMAKYSTEAVAAMGIVKKLDTLPLYFSIGVSNGLLPLLAYNFASGDKDRRRRIFRFGTALSAGFAVVCVIIYEIFAPLLAGIFISDAMTVGYAADFLRRMVTAMPLMAVCYPMIIQFQAAGRAKEALIVSVLRKGVIDVPIMFLFDAISPMYGCTLVQPVVDAISLFVAAGIYLSLRRKNEM